MKLFKKLRKGFTLIELVVVIAVIAILSAVAVVSYVSITNKAHQSNDQQKVDQVNLSLAATDISGKPATMAKALEAIEEDGFGVEKFKAEAKDYEFAYAMDENRIVILEKGTSVVYPKDYKQGASANIWRFASENSAVKADGFSYYLLDGCIGKITTAVNGGIDVGGNKDIEEFTIRSTQEKLTVNSGGDQCVAIIDAKNADVNFYGFAKRINVTEVKSSSLHIFGSVGKLQLEKGHAKVESTGIVFDLVQLGEAKADGTIDTSATAAATITNNGFIAEVSLEEHVKKAAEAVIATIEADTTKTAEEKEAAKAKALDDKKEEMETVIETVASTSVEGKEASDTLEISSLDHLESFRDAVNSGNNFDGLTVKLTKDIALKDGWKPIGEGTRSVAATKTDGTGKQTYFAGTFDGQNHTISNLNNKGFAPTGSRIDKLESPNKYSYGLFALSNNATFKNIKLTNVDIDSSRFSGAIMDSVGGLVGYSEGNLTVENVSVSGKIKANDSVCGLVGRVNLGGNSLSLNKCVSSVDIQAIKVEDQKNATACGLVRYYRAVKASNSVSILECESTGTVTSATSSQAHGMLYTDCAADINYATGSQRP